MKPIASLFRAGAVFVAFALLAAMPSTGGAAFILSDNLTSSTGGTTTATGDTWLAASFATGTSASELASVTLLLRRDSIAGLAEVDIYTDGGLEPGSLVGTLASPSTISTGLSFSVFTASNIALTANSTYWVVLKATTGAFDWAWTTSNVGQGVGFQRTWSQSDDAGDTWFSSDIYPFQMSVSVNAAAVPEPGSFLLLAVGAASLSLSHRLRRRDRSR